MEALTQSAKDLGSSTQFTAIQVGELQTEFAKLGFTTQQILDSTKATLDLAASMEVDLASAASLAGSTVSAFGLKASDTQEVVDVLALSTSASALDFSTLTESLKNVAPAATGLGKSVQETAALLGVMANAGKAGSLAGSQLRAAFITLAQKGLTVEEALKQINSQSTSTEATLKAIELGGKGGGQALSILASKEPEIAELTKTLEEAQGAAAAMAETRLDNLAGDTTKLSSAWEGFMLSLEDGEGIFNKVARFSVQWITGLISGITKASAFLGAFFSEINDSLSVFHLLKLGVKAAVDGIIVTFLELKKVIADIPFIGKGIDKKALQESQIAAVKSLAETTKQAAYWQDVADKRRESGRSFFERIQDRMAATALKLEEKRTADTNNEETKRDEVREEMSEKELARLRKLAEEKRKLEQKALQDEEKVSEFLTRKRNTDFENELLTLMQQYDKKFELARNNAELEKQLTEQQALDLAALRKKYSEEAEAAEAKANAKRILDEANVMNKKLQMTSDTLGAINGLVQAFANESEEAQRRAFNVNKAIGLAQAIISTAQGIIGQLAVPKDQLTGANFIKAGIIAATGIAQVATISKTRFESTGGGTPPPSPTGLGGGSGTGIGSQAPAFNVVGQSGFNQVAQALGQQNSTPIKAFVVSGDVTTAQALENNIIDIATF